MNEGASAAPLFAGNSSFFGGASERFVCVLLMEDGVVAEGLLKLSTVESATEVVGKRRPATNPESAQGTATANIASTRPKRPPSAGCHTKESAILSRRITTNHFVIVRGAGSAHDDQNVRTSCSGDSIGERGTRVARSPILSCSPSLP